jgi:hypothetical protein
LRTQAGVALTHEIKPSSAHLYPAYWNDYLRLLEFGYGQPDARVWNYWQEDFPLQISGSETASLVVSKPGQALLVVCDYGNGGDIELTLGPPLELGGKLTATDTESNEPLMLGDDGVISFSLKKHDFKVIRVEAANE